MQMSGRRGTPWRCRESAEWTRTSRSGSCGVLEICAEYGATHICAVMEPALIRLLRRIGLYFTEIGDLVNHHGLRQPCVARLENLVERNRADETLLWQYTASVLQSQDCVAAIAA